MVGPWCSFLILVGAHHHPLALPNLQAGACNRWWVGVFCFGGFERVSDMARLWGSVGAYRAGIPLLGSLSVSLCPPSLCRQPHIPFEREGDWVVVGVHHVFFVIAGRHW
jgi:hypothetical protein